jgi:hypothetical protein
LFVLDAPIRESTSAVVAALRPGYRIQHDLWHALQATKTDAINRGDGLLNFDERL